MASAKVPVTFTPVDARKVEAALARIQSQAKGVNFGRGAESINKLSRPLGKITGQANEFQKSLEASNARVLAFGASVAVINKLSQAFGALVSNTIKVEASFAKINTILGGTQKELEQFGNGIFKVAQQTGTSFDQVAEGALELARQGLSVEQSLSRVETALKLVRVSGIDAEKAVGGLTAAIKGFEGAGLTVAQIADKLAEVDTKFAVSTEDLINGLERASASARVAGVSFDELLGVVTTVQERTQRGGAVIGNAFKTIFARLGRTDTLQALQSLGISVLDAQGNVRGAIPLFQELATELDKLGLKSIEAGDIIQKVAGVRQRDILISLIEDLNSGQSQFAKSLQVSAGAAGALDEKNNKLNQTLEALINNLTVGSQKLASVLGDLGFSEAAADILKALSSVVNGITDLLQGEGPGAKFAQGLIKGIGSVLTGPGLALISAIFVKLFVDLAKFGSTSLKQILGINKAAQQQATLQQSVLQTLLQNETIQREILALEGNKVAQEQLLLRIYNQQAAALARVQKAAATVTPGLFRGGLRGGEGGVTRRSAGGYVAAEARDVSRGVGGATAGSKIVSIPNFAFGGGKRGTMVANTSEYFVPNYSGGGDAIFNRNMVRSMGLPSGARKLNAAGGFVPNFADPSRMPLGEVTRALGAPRMANPTNPKIRSEKAALLLRQRQLNRNKKQSASAGINFNSLGKIGVLSAFARGGSSIANTTFKELSPTEQNALKGLKTLTQAEKTSLNPSTPIRVRGIQNKSLENLDKNKVSNFRKNIDTTFAPALIDFATTLIKGVGIKNDEMGEFVKEVKNAKGNLFSTSVEGGIFESAIQLGTKELKEIPTFLDATANDRSPFDFEETGNASENLKKAFGFSSKLKKADAKRSSTPGAVASLIGKSLRDGIIKKFTKSAAGGYIPNFVGGALGDAISRERAAGLPINQIRINQSGKLRNATNPDGLAVTNTRDEPTGRIPNFAVIRSLGSKGGGNQALDKASQSADKMASSFDGLTMKLIGLQMVMSATTNVFEEQNKTLANVQNGLGSFLNTLMVLGFTGALKKVPGTGGGFGQAVKNFKRPTQPAGATNASGRGIGGQMQKRSGLRGAFNRAKGFGRGLQGSARFSRLGRAGLILGGTDAVMRVAGVEGGLLQGLTEMAQSDRFPMFGLNPFAGTTTRNMVTGAMGENLQSIKDRGFEDQGSVTMAKKVLSQIKSELPNTSDEKTKVILQKQIEEAEEIVKKYEELLNKQNERDAKISSGELIRSERASRGVTTFFGKRESKIQLDAERARATLNKRFNSAQTEERRAEITIDKERLALLEKEKLQRNENLNQITQGVIKSKELGVVEKQNLVNALASVDASTNSVDLAKKLEKEFGLTVEEGEKLVEQALLQKDTLDISAQRAHDLLRIRKAQLIADAKIADRQRQISDFYAIGAESLKQSTNKQNEQISKLQLSLNSGSALTPQQRRDAQFEIGKLQRSQRILDNEAQQAALRSQISQEDAKGEKKNLATLERLKAQQQTLLNQEDTIRRINALEEKRAKQIAGQTTLEQSNEKRRQALANLVEDVPDRLANNLESSIGSTLDNLAMGTYDSLGSVFLNVALDFGRALQQEISRAAAKSLVESFTSSGAGSGFFQGIGNFFGAFGGKGKNAGGLITGGSGVRDDVPAVLTGGEYVIRKSAVQKYGPDFLNRLNSGAIQGMQAGGFFVPGTRGQGEIRGKENLLAFAQQETTSGLTDVMESTGSGASISLEQQSSRLTAFGRFRDSPARRALKDAQRQAFDLYVARIEEDKRIEEERKAAEEARSQQFKSAIIGSFVSAAFAGLGSLFQNASKGVTNVSSAQAAMNSYTSQALGGYDVGSTTAGLTYDLGAGQSYSPFSVSDGFGNSIFNNNSFGSASQNSYAGFGPTSFGQSRFSSQANGGAISSNTNALLMGGEYVMSAPAAAQIGRQNLDNINNMRMANGGSFGNIPSDSAGGSFGSKADVGAVNIEINMDKDGSAAVSADSEGNADPTKTKEFARKVKEVVVNVIAEEKRVSGSLFTRRK
jgi:TP901 family phage tail tape measure protein